MSFHSLLDNVKYFLIEVLGTACGERKWTVAHVRDAYRWAAYVKQIHAELEQSADCSLVNKFIDLVLKENMDFTHDELGCIMKNPISSINKMLLQNPFLDDEVFNEILVHNFDNANENFEKDLWAVGGNCVTISKFYVESKEHGFNLFDKMLITKCLEDGSSDHLSNSAINTIIHGSLKTRDSLSFFLDTLVLLQQKASESKTLPQSNRANVRLKDLAEILAEKCFVENKRLILLSQDPRKLSNISAASFTFYKRYVEFLGQETEQLNRETAGNLPKWQPESDGMTFADLVVFWRHLMHGDNCITVTTKGMLDDFQKNSENEVWSVLIAAVV